MRGIARHRAQAEDPRVVEAADRLAEAASSGVTCPPVRELIGHRNVDAAWATQRLGVARALAAGRVLSGRKIGLTSAVVRQQFGAEQPSYGPLFADMAVPDGGVVARGAVLQPRVEAEVALVFGAAPPRGEVGVEELARSVFFAVPALEIADSRIADWAISYVDTVADGASGGRYVLGAPVPLGQVDVDAVRMELRAGAKVVSEGVGTDTLGGPLRAAAWLAAALGADDEPLRAGDVVLTGSLGPVVAAVPGGSFEARFTGLGTVSVSFAG